MVLRVSNLCKFYRSKSPVLDNCSFVLKPSTCLGLIGKNGAGKTSLLKVILGMITKTSGVIRYFGQNELNDEIKRKIGFYLGKEFLPEEMTGFQFLQFINRLYRPQHPLSQEAITKLINFFFENSNDSSKLISAYSFGMCQKIGICAALLTQPELLVLDEPFAGLDAFASNNLIRVLNKYKQNHSIIISSHDLHYLEKVSDQLLLLEKGKVIYEGSLENFMALGEASIEASLFKLFVNPEPKLETLDWLQ